MNEKPHNQSPSESERSALTVVIDALSGLETLARSRVLKTAATFYGVGESPEPAASGHDNIEASSGRRQSRFDFSEDRNLSPKDFLADKQPETDIERVACLAYYLTHYRDTTQFSTKDINKLNTEAAQIKFSNPAYAVGNATRRGFLSPVGKGMKQITAIGEMYVSALPDKAAAQAAISKRRSRSRSRTRKKS